MLVREDVLIPTGGASWRIVEVKASTKVKPEHVQDCATQAWVHQGIGYALDSISLAHIDNQFRFLQRSPQFLCFFDWPKQNLSIGRSKTFQLADTKGYNQPHD